ncbi:hypothetical protein Q9Q95_17480 [Sphingomonas sp. DG1-23]|nr:hypothetical protein [Sphingomonas sp. DG1-23]
MKLLLALAIAAAPASDGISAFAGGRVTSPDGKWAVWAAPADADTERKAAVARLNGPGVRDRELMRFAREIDVSWPAASDKVLLIQRNARFAEIYAFTLGPSEVGVDRIQSDLDRGMAGRSPKLASIANRRIALGKIGADTCVLVAESGLPSERGDGSIVPRRGAFLLDMIERRAMAIDDCPGARID